MASNQLQNLRLALDMVSGAVAVPEGFGIAPTENPRTWASSPNIQGFGIAERITQGKKLKDLALKIYVERKLPLGKLDSPIPKQVDLPGLAAPVPTDVQEIGKVEL